MNRKSLLLAFTAILLALGLAGTYEPAAAAAPPAQSETDQASDDCVGLDLSKERVDIENGVVVLHYVVPSGKVGKLYATNFQTVEVEGSDSLRYEYPPEKRFGQKEFKLVLKEDEGKCACWEWVDFPPKHTRTPSPTDTPVPTDQPTNTPAPTDVPPTETPEPSLTPTSQPTATGTSVPPTFTPTPGLTWTPTATATGVPPTEPPPPTFTPEPTDDGPCPDSETTVEVLVLYRDGYGAWLPLDKQRVSVIVEGLGEFFAETNPQGVAVITLPLPQNAYGDSELRWIADLRPVEDHPAYGWSWEVTEWGQIHGLRPCGRAFGKLSLIEAEAPPPEVPPTEQPPTEEPPAEEPAEELLECPVPASTTECPVCERLDTIIALLMTQQGTLAEQGQQLAEIQGDTQATRSGVATLLDLALRVIRTIEWGLQQWQAQQAP